LLAVFAHFRLNTYPYAIARLACYIRPKILVAAISTLVPMQEFTFHLLAAYFQVTFQDAAVMHLVEDIQWTAEELDTLNYTSEHTLVLVTVRDHTVPVSVILYQEKPSLELEQYDHVVECSLTMLSDTAVLYTLIDTIADYRRIPLAAGLYGVWLGYQKLDSLDELGLEGEDCYTIRIWKETTRLHKRILKQAL
jgi:hypothetical protein